MKDIAYLLASLDQLRNAVVITEPNIVSHDNHLFFTYNIELKNYKSVVTPGRYVAAANDMARSLNFCWTELKNRVQCYKQLVGLSPWELDTAACGSFLDAKNRIADAIDYAQIDQGGYLKYRSGLHTFKVPPDDYFGVALGAEGILDGLTIKDYAGSHYCVTTPAGKEHLVRSNTCSCREFQNRGACAHLKLVGLTLWHRRLLIENKLLVLEF
jgi:hypothetical protein